MRGSPPTMPCTSNRIAAVVPSSITPKPRSIFSGAGRRSCTSRNSSISTPRPAASTFTTPPHANDSTPGIKQQRLGVERLAEAHRVEQHRRLLVVRVVDDLHHAQRARRPRTCR